MKRTFLILFLITAVLLTACEARNERMLAGVWTGDGDLPLEDVDAPFTYVETFIFNTDFTGFALGSGEGITQLPFKWAVTDDTLTLIFQDIAVGSAIQITGNTLTIRHSGGSSHFKKLSADKLTFGGNHDQD